MCILLAGLLPGLFACVLFPVGDVAQCGSHRPGEWEDRACQCNTPACLLILSLFKQGTASFAFTLLLFIKEEMADKKNVEA